MCCSFLVSTGCFYPLVVVLQFHGASAGGPDKAPRSGPEGERFLLNGRAAAVEWRELAQLALASRQCWAIGIRDISRWDWIWRGGKPCCGCSLLAFSVT